MTYATERARLGREPCWLVEIDLPRCVHTFGVAPCNATGAKCYNTRFTCKDKANYSALDRTYRHSNREVTVSVDVTPFDVFAFAAEGPDEEGLTATALLTSTITGSAPTTYLWTVISEPDGANVTFDDATAANCTATYDQPGVYVFRVTATRGGSVAYNEVTFEGSVCYEAIRMFHEPDMPFLPTLVPYLLTSPKRVFTTCTIA